MSGSPVADRVSVSSPEGVITRSGVASFRKLFLMPETAEKFYNWTEDTTTKAVIGAIRDLALNAPVGSTNTPEWYAVQYGMSLGLNLAAQLMTDPSLVFPDVFRGRPVQVTPAPDATFDTDPTNL